MTFDSEAFADTDQPTVSGEWFAQSRSRSSRAGSTRVIRWMACWLVRSRTEISSSKFSSLGSSRSISPKYSTSTLIVSSSTSIRVAISSNNSRVRASWLSSRFNWLLVCATRRRPETCLQVLDFDFQLTLWRSASPPSAPEPIAATIREPSASAGACPPSLDGS